MTDKTASDAEPTDLKSALIELRHAREEITRLRPFVDMVDQAQRAADAAVLPAASDRCPHGCDVSTCPCLACEADQTALRDRIAAAIWERQNPGRRWADCEYRWRADAEADADAVLAVLPEPADRATVYAEVADRLAADAEQGAKEGFTRIYRRSAAKQVREWGEELRRMADEAQQPEICELPHLTIAEEDACEQHRLDGEAQQPDVEAHSARDRWYIEILDGDGWDLTSRFHTERVAAVRDMDRRNGAAPQWDDGKPVRRRLVRETTTHTVESEVSQPGKEA